MPPTGHPLVDPRPSEFYGSDRGDLELGVVVVTIPNLHVPGIVEAPSSWRLEFGPSPAKHVVLQSVSPVSEDVFYGRLQKAFSGRAEREAFVFIHGYNVGFEQAAKRAAQIAYDMNYAGVPVLYSWPSRGSTIGYVADSAVVRLSGRGLSLFLDDLVARSGASTIHIVAHSMGNRALTDALELMSLRHDLTADLEPIFGQILFADDSSALADMMSLFWQNTAPNRRCGLVVNKHQDKKTETWRYERGACSNKNLIGALAHMQRENVSTTTHPRAVLARTTPDKTIYDELEPVILKMVGD